MLKQKHFTFSEKRLLFLHAETPNPAASEVPKPEKALDLAKKTAKQAYTELKEKALNQFRGKALAEVKSAPPEIPTKLAGLKTDKPPIKTADGSLEQPFSFGDQKIQGKIIFPPKGKTDAKTTYLFNYVDNPDKFDHKKFLENFKKHQTELGNTIIITLKTPEGETKIDKNTVNTMHSLTTDLERFQADLKKDPKYADWHLPRAEKILHMTSTGESKKVIALLNKYKEASAGKDPRVAPGQYIIDSNDFSASLERALTPLTLVRTPKPEKSTSTGPTSTAISRPSSQPSYSAPHSTSAQPSSAPLQTINPTPSTSTETPSHIRKPPEGVEKVGPIKGHTGFFGDSISVSEQKSGHLDKSKFSTGESPFYLAKGGQTSEWLLNNLKTIPEEELSKMKNAVVLIGTNDIGGMGERYSAEAIIQRIKAIHKFFLEKKITVYACTIPPFKGHNFSTYRSKYDEVNKKRNAINDAIMADNRLKIIPLHRSEAQGGIASEDGESIGENYLVKYGRTIDYVHPQPKKLANLVETYIKSDQYKIESSAETPASPGSPISSAEKPIDNQPIGLPSSSPDKPSKLEKFTYTRADVQAADALLASLHKDKTVPLASHIGERHPLGNDKELVVAWHQDHDGQWGTPSYKEIPGKQHIGVQIEPARKHPADSAEA